MTQSGKHSEEQPISYSTSISQPETPTNFHYDVVVVGAGVSGLAACIFLQRIGQRVVCIESEPFPHAHVGESLEWSAPRLLEAIGLSRDSLVKDKIATYKRNINVEILGIPPFSRVTRDWLGKKPLEFEVTTLHVDRVQFDQRLFELAQDLGVIFVWDKVISLETEGKSVVACQTKSNGRFTASWFIDASGQAQVFAKAFDIPKVYYGQRKVSLWTYFKTSPYNHGTTFFGDGTLEYFSWIWDIPITPDVTSVGYITSADQIKAHRQKKKDVRCILYDELAKHPRFATLLAEQPDFNVSSCSYRSYVSKYVCGPNWLLAGESGSLPDPLTANGVTAALRHAREAATLIQDTSQQGTLSKQQQCIYNTNVCRMGHIFNYGIERAVYEKAMRRGLGFPGMVAVYTAFSYPLNALYAKIRPYSKGSMLTFGILLALVHLWIESWLLTAKLIWMTSYLWRLYVKRDKQSTIRS